MKCVRVDFNRPDENFLFVSSRYSGPLLLDQYVMAWENDSDMPFGCLAQVVDSTPSEFQKDITLYKLELSNYYIDLPEMKDSEEDDS